jgi:hypothetical protein
VETIPIAESHHGSTLMCHFVPPCTLFPDNFYFSNDKNVGFQGSIVLAFRLLFQLLAGLRRPGGSREILARRNRRLPADPLVATTFNVSAKRERVNV